MATPAITAKNAAPGVDGAEWRATLVAMLRPVFVLSCLFASLGGLACDTLFLTRPPIDLDDDDSPIGRCTGATVSAGDPVAMVTPRTRHAAALLADGRVLIAGGHDNSYLAISSAELFDPASATFASTGAMATPRQDFTLVALRDGRALAIGGFQNDGGSVRGTELWDDGTWSPGPELPEPRTGASAFVAGDGRVIIFGGQNNAESYPQRVLIFDPSDDTLASTSSDVVPARGAATAHTLADGRALMIGGYYTSALADVDVIFADGRATSGPAIPGARRSACAANDDVGDALVFGGYAGGALTDVQRFDAAGSQWSAAAPLPTARYACEAVTLSCAALVCGGVDTPTCDAYDFATGAFDGGVADIGTEFDFTMTALGDDRVLIAGGVLGDDLENVQAAARVLTLQ